ncbi:MAG: EAL domain-containing protein [Nitrospiraceae bacterium]|nr:EAL domain-containing protein [Nitrospiraceae bacterium]
MKNIRGERDRIVDIIENDGLTTHFQPICRGDGKVFGYEALSRFKGYAGFPGIADLFTASIRTGTILSLDMYCRRNAIREASGLIKNSEEHLFINICPETLLSPAHRGGITDNFVDQWGLSKERIILEITEETAISNYSLLKSAVSYYRVKGYRIAIDDFGIGFGGLKMLSIIRPDYVKIDRHFIQNIDKDFVNLAVVESVAVLCHRLDMKVIAEGVERAEEFTFADSLGIELFQGFYMGRPSPTGAVSQNKLNRYSTS